MNPHRLPTPWVRFIRRLTDNRQASNNTPRTRDKPIEKMRTRSGGKTRGALTVHPLACDSAIFRRTQPGMKHRGSACAGSVRSARKVRADLLARTKNPAGVRGYSTAGRFRGHVNMVGRVYSIPASHQKHTLSAKRVKPVFQIHFIKFCPFSDGRFETINGAFIPHPTRMTALRNFPHSQYDF